MRGGGSSSSASVAAVLAAVLGVAVSAQEVPRTSWGDPALKGIWVGSTLTPLERPSEYEGREFLSEEDGLALVLAGAAAHAQVGGNLTAGPPLDIHLEIATGSDGPVLSTTAFDLVTGEYYRLNVTSDGVEPWRLEVDELLRNSHLRLVTINGIGGAPAGAGVPRHRVRRGRHGPVQLYADPDRRALDGLERGLLPDPPRPRGKSDRAHGRCWPATRKRTLRGLTARPGGFGDCATHRRARQTVRGRPGATRPSSPTSCPRSAAASTPSNRRVLLPMTGTRSETNAFRWPVSRRSGSELGTELRGRSFASGLPRGVMETEG